MNNKTSEYLKRIKNIFGEKYDYSLVTNEIKNAKMKIKIRCVKHDFIFESSVCHLLEGHGCPECKKEKLHDLKSHTKEFFQKRLNEKFGDIYTVVSDYINNHTKITCKCSKCGGYFTRKPSAILDGVGCTNCYSSKLEQKVEKVLLENKIYFEREKCFTWLKKQRLDFFIPSLNIAIESHGKQHFISKTFFGGEDGLEKIRSNDLKKYKLCGEHNITIIYVANEEHDYFAPIIISMDELLTKINNSINHGKNV